MQSDVTSAKDEQKKNALTVAIISEEEHLEEQHLVRITFHEIYFYRKRRINVITLITMRKPRTMTFES